ncbi:MAG: type IV secretion system DotC family protein [Endozoicomonadaceae bacterium]|nr:type IV secretion system DotC family protein [Endozoicomonadaceae bacterium]
MFKFCRSVFIIITASLLSGNMSIASSLDDNNKYPELLSYLLTLDSESTLGGQKKDLKGLREKLLQNKGMGYGVQAGRYWATGVLTEYFSKKSSLLEKGFEFRPLLIEYKNFLIIPPVVEQFDGKTVFSDSGTQIRFDEYYLEIKSNPKFTTVIPTWREYIQLFETKPIIKYASVLPKADNEREIALWRDAVINGWKEGVQLAKRNAMTQLALLTYDYQGMVRFHLARHQNLITDLKVDEQFNEVVGGGTQMSINDVMINISVNPELNSNRHKWRPIPLLPPLKKIFPRGTYFNSKVSRSNGGED